MDNFDSNDPTNVNSPDNSELNQDTELSHSDKIIGIYTEPSKTFSKMAMFPVKTMDWLLPVVILLALVIISQILLMNNSEIYYQIKQKQIERIEKSLDDAVAKGQITQEQADTQMEAIRENLDKGRGPLGMVMQSVGIIIFGFIVFFVVSGIYFLFGKFIFKDQGAYNSVLVANGMTAYIAIIQVVLGAILSLTFGRLMSDVSVAALMNSDRTTFIGFVLSRLDIISIWSYAVLSIGLTKMLKASSAVKYFILVYGLWIGWGLLVFILGKSVPFLQNFAG